MSNLILDHRVRPHFDNRAWFGICSTYIDQKAMGIIEIKIQLLLGFASINVCYLVCLIRPFYSSLEDMHELIHIIKLRVSTASHNKNIYYVTHCLTWIGYSLISNQK